MADINKNGSSDNHFFGFAKPYFDFISKGKIYSIFYVVMAFLNLLLPLVVIYLVIDSGFLQNTGGRTVVAFMLSWLVIAFSSWICFQLWWNRKNNLRRFESADFIATPVISEIIQTSGECLGTFIIINGVGIGLIATILLWDIAKIPLSYLPFGYYMDGYLYCGPAAIVFGLVIGFFVILLHRFLAEMIRIWAAIANNTKDIARSLRK
ncbi:MAG: hypothetical protein FWD78_02275 [Treponema sp.]|nr:hypothetical protein [Treponema sp.]